MSGCFGSSRFTVCLLACPYNPVPSHGRHILLLLLRPVPSHALQYCGFSGSLVGRGGMFNSNLEKAYPVVRQQPTATRS